MAIAILAAAWGAAANAEPAGKAKAAEAAACRKMSFEGDGFTVCRYEPGKDEIRLAWRVRGKPLGSLAALRASLGADAARSAFAMNAGMYDPAQAPVGLYVEAGEAERPLNMSSGAGNFFLLPNGVFWIGQDGAPHVEETSAFAAQDPHPQWATQSGPLLVRAGALHPRIASNGTSLAVRNGVGVLGRTAVFAISDGPVSFGRLARLFRDGLDCPDALYFDGAVSSLWAPELHRLDGRTNLGTFVVVLRP